MDAGGYLVFGLVNLVLLIFAGLHFFKKPIRLFFSSRSKTIESRKVAALDKLNRTEETHQTYFSLLENIDQHMQSLMDESETRGVSEGEKMLHSAEEMADQIIGKAMARADHVVARKNREYFRDIVGKSVAEAEEKIKKRLDLRLQIELGRSFLERLAKEGL